jgi:dipeptidyl aminopeptidase/acylaminoacyl peptidase
VRAFVLASIVVLWAAATARATYPGRDGRIALFVTAGCNRYSGPGDPCDSLSYSAILAVSPFGHGAVDLLRCPGPSCVPGLRAPRAYSPDGRRLAVVVAADPSTATPMQVAILRSDGSEVRRVAVPASSIATLQWLPDGRRVAAFTYAPRVGREGRAFVLGADGTAAREVAWRPKGVRAWSSRGSVAVSTAKGIYVLDRPAGARRLILANGRRFTYGPPDWSPDGRRLVLIRQDSRTSLPTIITVAAGGGDRRVVVRGVGQTFGDVAWSPSGGRIAFTTGEWDGGNAVFTVRTDGTGLRRLFAIESLTAHNGLEGYMSEELSWQPLRR